MTDPQSDAAFSSECAQDTVFRISMNFTTSFLAVQARNLKVNLALSFSLPYMDLTETYIDPTSLITLKSTWSSAIDVGEPLTISCLPSDAFSSWLPQCYFLDCSPFL